ncbi:hypothetical protein ZHAS_00005708 [Anopheles sinensis]|uniref:Uncharacterized protein n=1 Tax=Anopheles sinensis TaxID=74873 RepID=A0A084VK60_ANOSI|nr:hypothetical protein ZHAS_00005708 [Anopheles sinensis]
MALNIAVPMSGVGDLLDGFGLLSPISPVSIGCHSSRKEAVSPVGSESSGVSSLDLEDIKKQTPSPPTLPDESKENSDSSTGGSSSPSSDSSSSSAASTISTTSSRTTSTSSSSSAPSSDDDGSQSAEESDRKQQLSQDEPTSDSALPFSPLPSPTSSLASSAAGISEPNGSPSIGAATIPTVNANASTPSSSPTPPTTKLWSTFGETLFVPPFVPIAPATPTTTTTTTTEPIYRLPRPAIRYANRNILDLASNIRWDGGAAGGPGDFAVHFAELPQTDNIQLFLSNRSQYHRLGPNGHIQEYRIVSCECCDFKYPVNLKNQSMRYGGGAQSGAASTSVSSSSLAGASNGGSNWKNNTVVHETAAKILMELNKIQQQQQPSYYAPFL